MSGENSDTSYWVVRMIEHTLHIVPAWGYAYKEMGKRLVAKIKAAGGHAILTEPAREAEPLLYSNRLAKIGMFFETAREQRQYTQYVLLDADTHFRHLPDYTPLSNFSSYGLFEDRLTSIKGNWWGIPPSVYEVALRNCQLEDYGWAISQSLRNFNGGFFCINKRHLYRFYDNFCKAQYIFACTSLTALEWASEPATSIALQSLGHQPNYEAHNDLFMYDAEGTLDLDAPELESTVYYSKLPVKGNPAFLHLIENKNRLLDLIA